MSWTALIRDVIAGWEKFQRSRRIVRLARKNPEYRQALEAREHARRLHRGTQAANKAVQAALHERLADEMGRAE